MSARGAVAAALAAALLGVGCGSRDAFDGEASFTEIEDAITDGGLEICETVDDADNAGANQAVAFRDYVVAFDCESGDTVPMAVDQFDSAADRDAAARNFESQVRPRGYGAVWTFDQFTIFTFGERDDDVEERLTEILDDLGAE